MDPNVVTDICARDQTRRRAANLFVCVCLVYDSHHTTSHLPHTSTTSTTVMSSAKPQIKRTYGARSTRLPPPPDTSKSLTLTKRKRPLAELLHPNVETPPKKQRTKPRPKKTNLTQLHFITESSILRTCPSCDLTYTRGAPDDEALHKAHCARVQRGFEWGKEDERDRAKANVFEVQNNVRLKTGESGRIVSLNVCCGGKLGQKVFFIV